MRDINELLLCDLRAFAVKSPCSSQRGDFHPVNSSPYFTIIPA